jgi:hypothetical protein
MVLLQFTVTIQNCRVCGVSMRHRISALQGAVDDDISARYSTPLATRL